jgi:hypothetical protein
LSARRSGTSPLASFWAMPRNGGFAHAGLADQAGIVLGAAVEDLDTR